MSDDALQATPKVGDIYVQCKGSWMRLPLPNRTRQAKVYHYTTPAGLAGIVGSHTIWASSPLALNDRSEVTYGISLLDEELASLDDARFTTWAQERLGSGRLHGIRDDVFFLCASRKPDLLNQWQGYAGQRGLSIGLDTEIELAQALDANWSTPRLDIGSQYASAGWANVVYSEAKQRRLIRRMLQFMGTLLRESDDEAAVAWHFDWAFGILLTQFKHPAFRDEREVRYIAGRIHGISERFRSGPYGIVPYVALASSERCSWVKPPLGTLPITSVRCGPQESVERPMAISATRRLLVSNGYDVPVSASTIPYRT